MKVDKEYWDEVSMNYHGIECGEAYHMIFSDHQHFDDMKNNDNIHPDEPFITQDVALAAIKLAEERLKEKYGIND